MTDLYKRILVLEDEPTHAEAIRRAFQEDSSHAEVEVVRSLREYEALSHEWVPDLAILDLNLPDGNAVDVLTSPAEAGPFPVLVMTSHGSEERAVEALRAGALDYLVKSPEAFAGMPRSAERALREWSLLQGRRRDETRIRHLNAVLRGIRNVNQLITQMGDRSALLQQACERLVESLGYRSVWIALGRGEGGLELAAQAGLPPDARERLAASFAAGRAPECARLALAEPGVVAVTLPRAECWECGVQDSFPSSGVLAGRLEHQGVVHGVMNAALPDDFVLDPEEQGLFLELAGDISFALYRLGLEEQKCAAEEGLHRSETRYRELVESLDEVVFLLDPEGRILFISPSVKKAFGFSPESLHGRPLQELVHPEDLEALGASFQRTLAGNASPFEFRGLDAEGRVRHLRATSQVQREEGRVVGVTGVVMDMTELREAVDRQRLAAERWQATFDAISDVVMVLSDTHEIIEINQAGCQAFAVEREVVLGQKCYEIVHGTDAPIPGCPCRLAAVTLEPTFLRHEERGRVFDFAAWPLPSQADRPGGFVHILRDITATETTLRDKERLEEQLTLSQRLEAIGRLAGGVAHDFNNLLSVIIANASFALEALRESDPIHADISEIQGAARRAASLTRQLLAFSRKQILEPEVLSVNDVVRGIEGMLRRLLGEDIDTRVVLAEPLGAVEADPGQLEQILMNLAVNARDAMPRGGRLTIETAEVVLDEAYAASHVAVTPGRYIRLSVSDSGEGMSPSTAEHVFEPFFTTKEKGKGTGLGLATVYGIVKQSGGNIWVYSEPGLGTTFKIYLPRVEVAPVDAKRRSDPQLVLGRETVLVVEDEPAVRRIAERILRMAGYHVLSAANGGEALLLCEKHGAEIALVLTDVVMPAMSGRELADRLSATRPGLKMLFMSGYTDSAIVHHGVLEPGMRFIGKPFTAPELTQKVREVLDEKPEQ